MHLYSFVYSFTSFHFLDIQTFTFQFERAFSAATVHDCFNWLGVVTLLVIEVRMILFGAIILF